VRGLGLKGTVGVEKLNGRASDLQAVIQGNQGGLVDVLQPSAATDGRLQSLAHHELSG
jgi:hypothetical protein